MKRFSVIGAAALVFLQGMPILPGPPPAVAQDDPCSSDQGVLVIEMNTQLLPGRDPGSFASTIPAGTYEITLVSADPDHPAGNQPMEQWAVVASTGGPDGTRVYESPFTDDLPGDVQLASYVVDSAAEVSQDVDTVSPVLIDGGGSVYAVCAIFDEVDDGENSLPVAADDDASGLEDDVIVADVVANDFDADGDPLVVSGVVAGPLNGSASTDGVVVTYTPNADWFGVDDFTYEVCDLAGLCDTAVVTVTVDPVNDAPSFVASDPAVVSAGGGAQVVAGWAEFSPGPDNESSQGVAGYTVSGVSAPGLFAAGPVVDSSGGLLFTPSGVEGSSQFTVTVQDDGGTANGGVDTSPPQTFTLTVEADETPTNRPPTARDDVAETDLNTTVRIDVLANDSDPDNDRLILASVDGPRAIIDGGVVVYTPRVNVYGVDRFRYTVCDSGEPVRCATGDVTVDVNVDPLELVDIEVALAASQQVVGVEQVFAVTVTVTNTGPALATGVRLALPLPAGVEGRGSLTAGGPPWMVEELDAGESDTAVFSVQAAGEGAYDIVAELIGLDQADIDSVPDDGRGDDYAVTTIDVQGGEPIGGFVFVDDNEDGLRGPAEGPPEGVSKLALTVRLDVVPAQSAIAVGAGFASLVMPAPVRTNGSALVAHGASGLPSLRGSAALVQACQRDETGVESGEPFARHFDDTGRYAISCGSGIYAIDFPVGAARALGYELANPDDRYRLITPITTGTARRDYALVRIQDDPLPEMPQSLSGTVWFEDADGERSGAVGVPITVRSELDRSFIEPTQSGLSGEYKMPVAPGSYVVEIDVPAGFLLVEPRQGGYIVEVPPGDDIENLDFTLTGGTSPTRNGSITGIVWLDKNRNGLVDTTDEGERAEPVIGGATVTLRRAGSVVGTRATTDIDGGFTFGDLEPGAYGVRVGLDGPVSGYALVTSGSVDVTVEAGEEDSAFIPFGFAPASDFGDKTRDSLPTWPFFFLLLLLLPLIWWMPPPRRPPRLFLPPIPVEPGPYPGPRPFTPGERDRFFGRDDEIRTLVSMTYANRVTVLFGPSGAGKTSLLLAGYVPALDPTDFEVLPVVQFQAGEVAGRPVGQNSFVAAALATWAQDRSPPPPTTTVAGYLAARPRIEDSMGEPAARVLIFDQFDEVFASYPERWQERHDFFVQLDDLLLEDGLDRIVIALREEQLGELEPLLVHLELQARGELRLDPLEEHEARDALEGPLTGTADRFAPGVIDNVVRDLRLVTVERAGRTREAQGEFIDPLRLQLVATAAWRRRGSDGVIQQAEVQVAADTERAAADFYDEAVAYAGEVSSEAAVRAWVAQRLILPIGSRAALVGAADADWGIPSEAVDRLAAFGLVIRQDGGDAVRFQLAHERFVGPILLSNDISREGRLVDLSSGLLTRAAAVWEEHDRDPAYLLDGSQLADAMSAAAYHPQLLIQTQREFLDASAAAAATTTRS